MGFASKWNTVWIFDDSFWIYSGETAKNRDLIANLQMFFFQNKDMFATCWRYNSVVLEPTGFVNLT